MNRLLASAAVAAIALCGASVAAAQDTGSSAATPPTEAAPATSADAGASPSTTAASTSADDQSSATTPSAAASGANASVTTGMTVKDNTGATIGTVSDVKTDASGKQMATIKMGADSFQVDTTRLAVGDGAATVNATADDIRKMLKK